jgi:hypothetical protein
VQRARARRNCGVTITPKNSACEKPPVQELVPQPDTPAERHTHKIVMNVFGKRYEITRHTEVRLLAKRPAKVVQMPIRPTIER